MENRHIEVNMHEGAICMCNIIIYESTYYNEGMLLWYSIYLVLCTYLYIQICTYI